MFTAGRARLTLSQDTVAGRAVWRATASAQSTGFVSRLYKVDDTFRSFFHNGALCSEEVQKTIHEGRRHREIRVEFQNNRHMAVVRETDLSNNSLVRLEEHSIPPCAFDVVSALYYVRGQKLEVGKTLKVPVNDGSRTMKIEVEVQAREEIKTPAGVFQAIRLEPQVFGGTLFKRSGRMFLWLSDDPAHRLLQLKAKLFFGTITAALTRASY